MPSRGYVCNNAVTFICSIVASKPAQCEAALDGIRGIKRRSTDFKILVGDREFYVNRGLLATHCEYFDGLFYGNYGERHRDEIHLDDVDADDSEKFMRLIVPPQEPISGMRLCLEPRFLKKSKIYN